MASIIPKPKQRISNIHLVNLDGQEVKMFRVDSYRSNQNDYIPIGVYHAPKKTPNRKLKDFIPK